MCLDAYAIVSNTGIKPEYSYIKDNVPINSDSLYKGQYASYGNGRKSQRQYADFTNAYKRSYYYQAQLSNILESGVFDNVAVGNIGSEGYFGILSKSVPVEIKTGTYLNLELTSNKRYVDITAFIVENKNHKMITAFYDESGVLVSLEINNVSESGNYRYYVPSKASKIVTYLIDDINNTKPVCGREKVYK